MNQKLLKALQALEPEIRALGDNVTISITTDPNGTTFSLNVNDGKGGSENTSKRIPR